jgi:hypothetical protein
LLRRLDQRAGVERFADEALGAARLGFAAERSSTFPENMTTGSPDTRVLVDLLQHLPAVDLRHHHVEQDQIW